MANAESQVDTIEDPEELRLQRLGARLLIMELLGVARADWNGYGIRLWAERKTEELDGQSDNP